MSGSLLGNHFSHGIWLPVNQYREYHHESTPLAIDNINLNTNRLIRYLNKVFTNLSLEANEFEISIGREVMIFRHEYQTKEKVGNYLFILQERRISSS